jgi:hypothetical protein
MSILVNVHNCKNLQLWAFSEIDNNQNIDCGIKTCRDKFFFKKRRRRRFFKKNTIKKLKNMTIGCYLTSHFYRAC